MSNYTKSTNFATKDNLTPGDPLKIVRGTEIDTEFNNIATAIATKTDNASAAITGGTINDTTIGATTASTGAFTTISATGAITSTLATGTAPLVVASTTKVANLNVDSLDGADWASPAALGSTTPAAVSATTLSASGNVTLSGGTANGVAYLNGSKVVTSGSALVFDGTSLGVGTSSPAYKLDVRGVLGSGNGTITSGFSYDTGGLVGTFSNHALGVLTNGNVVAKFDTSGNLGLGVTPSASVSKTIQIGGYSVFSDAAGGGGGPGVSGNAYEYSAGAYKYLATYSATLYRQNYFGAHEWFVAPSGTAGNAITFTQAMTLDASGNWILGGTSANGRARIVGASSTDSILNLETSTNNYASGIQLNALNANGASYNYISSKYGSTENWYIGGNGVDQTLVLKTGGSERARIDSSGNLMVGTTTPTANCKLTVTGAGISIAGGRGSTFALAYPDWSIYNTSSGNALAFDNGSERVRIDSSGNLMVNTTSDIGGLGGKVQIASGASRGLVQSINANTRLQEYLVSGSTVGFISTDGTNTTYSTSSDYRLKNTIAPMTGALAKVALLKPCTYKWNADGSDGQGFIAHELAEVVPQCVTGEKDAVNEDGNPQYQGIDTSFLVATLTAALQEAHGLIKNLETRISALEAK